MQRLEVTFFKLKDCPQVLLEVVQHPPSVTHFPSDTVFGKKEENKRGGKWEPQRSGCFLHTFSWGWSGLEGPVPPPRALLSIPKVPLILSITLLSNMLLGTPGNISILWSPAYLLHIFFFFSFPHSIDLCNLATWKAKEQHASSNSIFETSQGTIKIPEFIRDAIYLQGGECGHGGWWGEESFCCS